MLRIKEINKKIRDNVGLFVELTLGLDFNKLLKITKIAGLIGVGIISGAVLTSLFTVSNGAYDKLNKEYIQLENNYENLESKYDDKSDKYTKLLSENNTLKEKTSEYISLNEEEKEVIDTKIQEVKQATADQLAKEKEEKEAEEDEAIEGVEEKGEDKSETEEILNVDNCEELAAILSLKDEFDTSIKVFAEKYDGRIIEFDGNVAYVSPHENYDTRFDYLIYVGDYNEDFLGPRLQFENVNYYDLHLKGDNIPDTFGMGINIHIVAEIEEYDENSGLFKLTPVSITMR